jgi:hypothetical protein
MLTTGKDRAAIPCSLCSGGIGGGKDIMCLCTGSITVDGGFECRIASSLELRPLYEAIKGEGGTLSQLENRVT